MVFEAEGNMRSLPSSLVVCLDEVEFIQRRTTNTVTPIRRVLTNCEGTNMDPIPSIQRLWLRLHLRFAAVRPPTPRADAFAEIGAVLCEGFPCRCREPLSPL